MAVGIPLGPYRLIRRLAAGGMAEIFLARQEGPDGFERELVVKRILPHLAADPEFTRMFRDEAKLAARLSHPNIVHVYDFGAEADLDGVTLYLAMELVRGVDLRALILRARAANAREGIDGAIPPHHAAKIASYVCEALAHAHMLRIDGAPAGIVHRDVTPSNVLVSFDGAVKLADFGIAKAATTTERTAHGVVKGKHSYLSPEQARGEELDATSDLFNVGILLFESILGEALFPPNGTLSARKLSARGEIPGRERFRRMPEELARIATRALAARPEDRYEHALSLRGHLEHYLRTVDAATGTVEIGEFVRATCPEELFEDAIGPRAAGTVATRALTAEAGAGEPGGEPEADALASSGEGTSAIDADEALESALSMAKTMVQADAEPALAGRHTPAGEATPVLSPAPSAKRGRLAAAVALLVALAIGLFWIARASRVSDEASPTGEATVEGTPRLAAARRTGVVRVSTDPPGASVVLDDVTSGVTPFERELPLGAHRVEVSLAGFAPERELARLEEPGERVSLSFSLRALAASEDGLSDAGASRPASPHGEAGRGREAGSHRDARGGASARVARPAGATGTLRVTTTPWSNVYEGSRLLGQTPIQLELSVGRHALTFRAEARPPHRESVEIRAGEVTRLRLVL